MPPGPFLVWGIWSTKWQSWVPISSPLSLPPVVYTTRRQAKADCREGERPVKLKVTPIALGARKRHRSSRERSKLREDESGQERLNPSRSKRPSKQRKARP